MESLSSIFQSPLATALISPLLAFVGLTFFWFRVGSLHSLLERIWRLVTGKAEVENPQLKKLIQENRDLERFRFIYGLKIETQPEFQRLMSWLHRHKVGIARLQRVRKWIGHSFASYRPQATTAVRANSVRDGGCGIFGR
ncbi:DUF6216 family protein [Cupriavidus basilensis]|uniref:DUF6216 family protein n=1 Tax=Cupriavidus basilensis TaxID=68895 RepID=UPI001146C1D2|nr:DUF6216 family protein [Cupriavidus basilensis]